MQLELLISINFNENYLTSCQRYCMATIHIYFHQNKTEQDRIPKVKIVKNQSLICTSACLRCTDQGYSAQINTEASFKGSIHSMVNFNCAQIDTFGMKLHKLQALNISAHIVCTEHMEPQDVENAFNLWM